MQRICPGGGVMKEATSITHARHALQSGEVGQVGVLYANGCSMTYGYELIDDPQTHVCLDDAYREAHAWPGRLAVRVGAEKVVNDSIPGGSNDRILRTTIQWVTDFLGAGGDAARRSLLVVIGWSDPMRREYFVGDEWKQTIPYHDYPDLPALDRLNKVYREVAWNDHESACRFATQALALQAFLQHHRVRFLFFDALKSCQETFAAARQAVAHTRALNARTYLHFGDCGGSMASILSAETPHWKGRHPAEDGHDYWAGVLAGHLRREALLALEPGADAAFRSAWFARLRAAVRHRRGVERGPFIYP
ncbi:hypothetical protein OEJ37_01760 [Burkholderia sp. BKH01]|uniref:DUF6071 family protein n=1 Tax=Burkholderia sp. BKH01 TaxID=2769262 RepID=UPI0021DFD124|nr:DUF6071 family protein [Burkholderia sp. BKH01]MCU9952103.1 hypothetical protein [Burkholderia sp. BKH01]